MIIRGHYVVWAVINNRDYVNVGVFEMARPAGGCEGGGVERQTLREGVCVCMRERVSHVGDTDSSVQLASLCVCTYSIHSFSLCFFNKLYKSLSKYYCEKLCMGVAM